MTKKFYTHDEIVNRPELEGYDPSHVHFHFRPARPANFCVTLDPDTNEVNVMSGTIGPLTWNPYTMCLHVAKSSVDSYRNLQRTDECVIALPGKDIIDETWVCQLRLPRGINEIEVADLTSFDSKFIEPPSIKECKVNFECKVEFFKDYYTHAIVFVRVVGASIDEDVLEWSREEVVDLYPTYEVDDIDNSDVEVDSAIERLGVMGKIFECPRFPVGPKRGWGGTFKTWMDDLKEDSYITEEEYKQITELVDKFEDKFYNSRSQKREKIKKQVTKISRLMAWEKWDELSNFLEKIK